VVSEGKVELRITHRGVREEKMVSEGKVELGYNESDREGPCRLVYRAHNLSKRATVRPHMIAMPED